MKYDVYVEHYYSENCLCVHATTQTTTKQVPSLVDRRVSLAGGWNRLYIISTICSLAHPGSNDDDGHDWRDHSFAYNNSSSSSRLFCCAVLYRYHQLIVSHSSRHPKGEWNNARLCIHSSVLALYKIIIKQQFIKIYFTILKFSCNCR